MPSPRPQRGTDSISTPTPRLGPSPLVSASSWRWSDSCGAGASSSSTTDHRDLEPQRVETFALLRRLAAESLIVIFVTHKLDEVEALCHQVTVMSR